LCGTNRDIVFCVSSAFVRAAAAISFFFFDDFESRKTLIWRRQLRRDDLRELRLEEEAERFSAPYAAAKGSTVGDPRNELYGHPGASIFPRGETGVCHRRRRHTPVKMDSDPSLCASKGKVVILCPTGLDDNPRQEIHYCSFSLASTTYCRRHRPNSRSLLNGEGAAGV